MSRGQFADYRFTGNTELFESALPKKGEAVPWRWIEGSAVEISAEAETGSVDGLGGGEWESRRRDDGKGGHCRSGRETKDERRDERHYLTVE